MGGAALCAHVCADTLRSGPPQTHLMKDSFNVSQDLPSLSLPLIWSHISPPENVSLQRSSEPSQRQRGGETCLTQQSWKTVVVDRRRPESPHSRCTDNVGKTSTFLGDVSVATVVVL